MRVCGRLLIVVVVEESFQQLIKVVMALFLSIVTMACLPPLLKKIVLFVIGFTIYGFLSLKRQVCSDTDASHFKILFCIYSLYSNFMLFILKQSSPPNLGINLIPALIHL